MEVDEIAISKPEIRLAISSEICQNMFETHLGLLRIFLNSANIWYSFRSMVKWCRARLEFLRRDFLSWHPRLDLAFWHLQICFCRPLSLILSVRRVLRNWGCRKRLYRRIVWKFRYYFFSPTSPGDDIFNILFYFIFIVKFYRLKILPPQNFTAVGSCPGRNNERVQGCHSIVMGTPSAKDNVLI